MQEQIIDNKNGTYSFKRNGVIYHTGKWGDNWVAPKVIEKNQIVAPTKVDFKPKLFDWQGTLNPVSKLTQQPQTTVPLKPGVTMEDVRKTNEQTQLNKPKIVENVAPKNNAVGLFKDEQTALEKMKQDGLDENKSIELIKQRRTDLMGGNTKLNPIEGAALLKMQQDGLTTTEAVDLIKQFREKNPPKDTRPLWKKAGEGIVNFGAGNLETILKYGGNLLDIGTGGQLGFGEEVKQMTEQNKELFKDSAAFTAGTYLPDVALTVAPLGKAIQGMSAVKGGALVGAGYGALNPMLNKGSETTVGDVVTGGIVGGVTGAIAGPVIGKTLQKGSKYGTALLKGGLQGFGKSVSRDVKGIGPGISKGIQKIADVSATNINRMTAGQIRNFNKEIGVSPGKFLLDRGITDTGDSLVVKLSDNLVKSRKAADLGLSEIKGRFKAPSQEIATTKINKEGKIITKKSDPIETMLKDNLNNASSKGMSKESLRAKQLLEKYQEGGLTMSEINEAKRFLNANNKFSYFSDDVSPRKGFVTNLDNEVRKWQFNTAIEKGFTNLKDINKDTKAYFKLLEGIGGWQDKIAGNNPLGLTDWLAFNADPGIFLAKQIAQSNIAKRSFLKGVNAISGRKIQSQTKLPSNLKKNDILNSSSSSSNISSTLKNVKPTKIIKK